MLLLVDDVYRRRYGVAYANAVVRILSYKSLPLSQVQPPA